MNGDYGSTSDNVTCFHSFGVEYFPKEIEKFIGNKNMTADIRRIQVYQSIMCEYFFVGFVDFKMKDKSLLDYKNVFFRTNEYIKNCETILDYFQ